MENDIVSIRASCSSFRAISPQASILALYYIWDFHTFPTRTAAAILSRYSHGDNFSYSHLWSPTRQDMDGAVKSTRSEEAHQLVFIKAE